MPAPQGHCLRALEAFRQSKQNFNIIYGGGYIEGEKRVLVLDSSFNPPHMGHYTLVQKALKYYGKDDSEVLLLLSVNNADKKPKPASFDKRMDMMCLMADMLNEDSIPASVGITTFGKFMDKSSAILQGFGSDLSIVYLVGFDTIVRIFDPKYYAPHLPSKALQQFMLNTQFYCLTRGTAEESIEQLHYSADIREGKHLPNIPKSWCHKIHVDPNDEKYASVSSSMIRDCLYSSPQDVSPLIPSRINSYIKELHPNSNIFQ